MLEILKNHSEIITFFSRKSDGNMLVSNESPEMAENRRKFVEKLGFSAEKMVSGGLVHGNKIALVSQKDAGKIIPGADGLITQDKNIFLTVTTADCLPVFFYDPVEKIVGIAHAGWQGLAQNILANTIDKFVGLGSEPKNILVGIGPGICAGHYTVGEERAAHFENYSDAVIKDDGRNYLDLKKIAEIQLTNAGILLENIETSPECTFENPEKYFSFRRDKPQKVEAMIAGIGINSEIPKYKVSNIK